MKKYEKIYYILLDNEDRTIQISKNVYNFKKEIMNDVSQSLPNSYLISSQNFKNQINKLEGIDIIYPNVGENLDFIAKLSKENRLKTNYNLCNQTKKVIPSLLRHHSLLPIIST